MSSSSTPTHLDDAVHRTNPVAWAALQTGLKQVESSRTPRKLIGSDAFPKHENVLTAEQAFEAMSMGDFKPPKYKM